MSARANGVAHSRIPAKPILKHHAINNMDITINMTDILTTLAALIVFWLIAIFTIHGNNTKKRRAFNQALQGRIVKIETEDTDGVPVYAIVLQISDREEDEAINQVRVREFETKEGYKERFEIWEKQHKAWEARKKNQRALEQSRDLHYQQIGWGYSDIIDARSQDPEPYWEDRIEYEVDWIDCKIMPEGFDPRTKKLALSQPKGGEKKKVMRKMPRLFRYALYAALVVLVWDAVLHANDVAIFTVNTFLLHK